MLTHIVMWKFKDEAEGADKATNIARAKALLEACATLSPGTLRFEVMTAQPGTIVSPLKNACAPMR